MRGREGGREGGEGRRSESYHQSKGQKQKMDRSIFSPFSLLTWGWINVQGSARHVHDRHDLLDEGDEAEVDGRLRREGGRNGQESWD